jgi:hypothetical protein
MDQGEFASQIAVNLWPLACFYLGCWSGKTKPGGWRLLGGLMAALGIILIVSVAVELIATATGFAP